MWQLIEAPASSGARAWLALKRFDYLPAQEKAGRLHMHSACGLLDADFRSPSVDYSDLIKAGRQLCKSPAAGQLQFRRAMFNLFAANQDDHSKNWGYLDGFEDEVDLRTFWLFMLWRIQSHNSVDQLVEEVMTAFPDLLQSLPSDDYFSAERKLSVLIESRFIERFLQFWGFIIIDPRRYLNAEPVARIVQVQPLLKHTFQFTIKT